MTSSTKTVEMMKMSNSKKFVAQVRLANSSVQKLTIEADDVIKARLMLEAQYGKGNVIYVGHA